MNILFYSTIGVIVIIGTSFLSSYFKYYHRRKKHIVVQHRFDSPNTIPGIRTPNGDFQTIKKEKIFHVIKKV